MLSPGDTNKISDTEQNNGNDNFVKSPQLNDVLNELRNLRIQNIGRVIVATLNVNSIAGKFEQLKLIIKDNIDIIVITETKIDDSFPESQFSIDGFSVPYRLDRNSNGGGVLIFVREDIPGRQLNKHTFPDDIEGVFFEINLRKTKWLLFGTYHPPSQSDDYYFDSVSKALDLYYGDYDKFLLTGDFNAEDTEPRLASFLDQYDARNIVKLKTCFKSIENLSCVDLLITNSYRSFQHTQTISTGLSDFHKMSITVLKTKYEKMSAREVNYRDYKNFNDAHFKRDLLAFLPNCTSYESFEDIFLRVLEKHAPLKKKYIRANEVPYMTKSLKKAIMKRSQLESKYYRSKSEEDKKVYKKQKNYVSRLYKRELKRFYKNLDIKDFLDNKTFWKNVKPLFSDKMVIGKKITIVQNKEIFTKDEEVVELLNAFFRDAVDSLDIPTNTDLLNNISYDNKPHDPIDEIIEEFSSHPSILMINEKTNNNNVFDFTEVDLKSIETEISKLDPKKSTTFKSIPTKIIKETKNICAPILHNLVNSSIRNSTFPDKLKLPDVAPVFKKGDPLNVKNYRPVSVLPAVSKIYERIIQEQLFHHIESHLSNYMCGYRKGYSAQHALVLLIEKWREILDKKGYAGAILMDLSKAFDTINHKLLIAKLHAYGFSKSALKLIKSYLSNRWQRTKINTSFSSWTELSQGVPQGSVLGPLLFNIYLNDLFWFTEHTDACNFADDNSFHASGFVLEDVIRNLEHDSLIAIEWFGWNYMKLNEEKCHLLIAGHKHEWCWAQIGTAKIWESYREKLLGLHIDRDLNFNYHISNLCAKAGRKLSALIRLCKFYSFDQRRTLMKSFIESQFSYTPLGWMFHDRDMNNKINKLHERALRIVYKDDLSTFGELLLKDNSICIHHRNIHFMAIEMHKLINDNGPALLNEIFMKKDDHYIRTLRSKDFLLPQANTVHYGHDSLKYFGPKIWGIIPNEIKSIKDAEQFKIKLKTWVPSECPCRLCKIYVNGVGYIN